MGSSESKIAVCAAVKPEPAIKDHRIADLKDPRSPSAVVDRTPIQVRQLVSKTSTEVTSECPLAFGDPRSPSVGIARTPVREAMRVTVGTLARRLGSMFFHNEIEGKEPQKLFSDDAVVEEEEEEEEEEAAALKGEKLNSTAPLLTPQASRPLGSPVEHANFLFTPVPPSLHNAVKSSPFVLLDKPQMEVEIEVEADFSLEEAEEAKESPLQKRLSMSLITCHEGVASSQVFAEVHHDSSSSPVPCEEVDPSGGDVDHLYALPSTAVEPECHVELSQATDASPIPSPAAEQVTSPGEAKEASVLPASSPSEPPTVPSPEQTQHQPGFHRLTFDPKSPSQVVLKPQWLGKGFGANGLRARAVKGHGGKRGSSPLAVSVAVRNVTKGNKRLSGKLKQKGSEVRSPLQVLKTTNSPRAGSQMKLKVSTPEKPRLAQMDRRVLAVALDKENR